MHINAVTLVTTLHLLALCRLAVRLAHRKCPPPLPAGPGGAPRTYTEESLLLIALLRTLWRLSYQDMSDWLHAWPALALACGLPLKSDRQPRIPSPSQQWKRNHAAGAPLPEALFVLTVQTAIHRHLLSARDLIIDSAPILAWRRTDPDAAIGHAPAHHPRLLLRGFRIHTLLCRGSGLPVHFLVSPANVHDAPFARPLLEWAVRLYHIRPRVIRLDAGYWGLRLIAWIHAALGAVAVIPWNPKRQKNRSCLPPTWTAEELSKRTSIERFFGRVFLFFHLQRPPLCGWSAIVSQVALAYTATLVVALVAQHAGRPDLIRSPKRVSPIFGRAFERGNALVSCMHAKVHLTCIRVFFRIQVYLAER
ncbi:MAG TPA: transposase [Ktedonobacteraceae bacterium]|nr:transposase [Ktedonobacteraceae bacterium]